MCQQHDTVTLRVAGPHIPFVRQIFETARDGILDDLARFPEGVSDPSRSRRLSTAYERLIKELDFGVITGDRTTLKALLADQAAGIDGENEYGRVVAEHDAFAHLLVQLDGEKGRDA